MTLELQDVADLLPPIVHDMIELVGFNDTEKLIKAFGGLTLYLTDDNAYYQKLVELLGEQSAVKLRDVFYAEYVYVPRCEVALRTLRNQQFKADFDFLTQEKKISGRQAMIELCPKYHFSDRCGWDIIYKARKTAEQQALF